MASHYRQGGRGKRLGSVSVDAALHHRIKSIVFRYRFNALRLGFPVQALVPLFCGFAPSRSVWVLIHG